MKLAGSQLPSPNVQLAETINIIGQNLANKVGVKVNQLSTTMLGYVDNNRQVLVNLSIRQLSDPVFNAKSVFVPAQNGNNTGNNNNPGGNYPGNGSGNGSYPDNGNGGGNTYYPDPGPDPIPVTNLILSEQQIELPIGGTYQLAAAIEPDNATNQYVVWESDNDGVATVDQDGYVTAVDEGLCSVSVSTQDGTFTEYCDVEVIDTI